MLCGPLHESSRNKARDVNALRTALHVSFCACPGLVITSGRSEDVHLWEGPVLEKLKLRPPGSLPNLSLLCKPKRGGEKHLAPPTLWWDVVNSQCPHLGCAPSHMTLRTSHGSSAYQISHQKMGCRLSNQGCGEDEMRHAQDKYLQKTCSVHLYIFVLPLDGYGMWRNSVSSAVLSWSPWARHFPSLNLSMGSVRRGT